MSMFTIRRSIFVQSSTDVAFNSHGLIYEFMIIGCNAFRGKFKTKRFTDIEDIRTYAESLNKKGFLTNEEYYQVLDLVFDFNDAIYRMG